MNSDFLDIRFPDYLAVECRGGPKFKTNISISNGGAEFRRSEIAMPCFRYIMPQMLRSIEEANELQNIFILCMGRAIGFRFRDWSDYKILNQEIGIGDGVTNIFPIYKTYVFGVHQFRRRITKPSMGQTKINGKNVLSYSMNSYSIDCNTGLVHFKYPPAPGERILCDSEFDVPVRFDCDELSYSPYKGDKCMLFGEFALQEFLQ